jgi:hypothetical protein
MMMPAMTKQVIDTQFPEVGRCLLDFGGRALQSQGFRACRNFTIPAYELVNI